MSKEQEGVITNWVEFAKEQGWISEVLLVTGPAKKYLPEALQEKGGYGNPTAIYTDDGPLEEDGSIAILTDQQGSGHCWLRGVRVEGGQVFVTSPLWPRGGVPFPLDDFKTIERVILVLFDREGALMEIGP